MNPDEVPSAGGGDVLVIGGGFAGAAAALRLAEAGRRVRLLEAGPRLGGRTRSVPDPKTGGALDWGPHLFMAANPALRSFLARIGAERFLRFDSSLDISFRRGGGDVPRLARLVFPPDGRLLGQVGALLRWRGPGLADRLKIALGLRRMLSPREGGEGTVAEMLARAGQGASARRWFWEPFARAVLNLPPEQGSAALFRRVLAEAFGAGPAGAAVAAPAIPLGEFFSEWAAARLRSLGGEIRVRVPVRRLIVEGAVVRGVETSGGGRIESRAVISAVPPRALLALLPPERREEAPWPDLARLRAGPIASAYLWLDGPEPGPPFEALVGEPWHWLFRFALRGGAPEEVALLAGGGDSVAAGARGGLEASARETAERLFPGRRVERALVFREREATWANGAEEQGWRPGPETPLRGLFLAGDWTATGLPATVEGAVRSGEAAAGAVLSVHSPAPDGPGNS